jgi:hypothetical protein
MPIAVPRKQDVNSEWDIIDYCSHLKVYPAVTKGKYHSGINRSSLEKK